MTAIQRTNVLSGFSCLGDKCEDTCCQNWSMQVDAATRERYQTEAPQLLDAIEASDESPWIMRKDPASGFCVKLEGGLCGIHKQYGDRFLGDACHFYPRVTRRLGSEIVMTASMSCPEIARLALYGAAPCDVSAWEAERLPSTLKDYLPAELQPQEALAIHAAFIDAAKDESCDVERSFLRIASAARSLERIEKKSWPAMASYYLAHADTRIPPAETAIADPFNLLHALCGLIVAAHKPISPRLRKTIDAMEQALSVTLDWQNVAIHTGGNSLATCEALKASWNQEMASCYAPPLRRWLQMQMSLALFPYSGLGATLSERVTIIGVRLATIKLALLCSRSIQQQELPQDVVVRVIQSLSRFLDHLGDPAFSLKIYTETGWIRENRMHGLLI